MEIRQLRYIDLCNAKFRTQFFELLDTEVLDQATAISVFNHRDACGNVMTFIGIDEQNVPIATVSLILEHKFIHGGIKTGHIEDVAIHPKNRNQGLGTEIMTHVMNHAKQHCKRVVLECKPSLQQFYQKHGFLTQAIAMRQQNDKLNKPDFSRKIEDHEETNYN